MNRWQRPGDELHTNVPGLLTQKEFENTLSRQFWFGKSYEFADNIWTMYDYSNLRVVSGDYVKLRDYPCDTWFHSVFAVSLH